MSAPTHVIGAAVVERYARRNRLPDVGFRGGRKPPCSIRN
jgi:hypothetical protein